LKTSSAQSTETSVTNYQTKAVLLSRRAKSSAAPQRKPEISRELLLYVNVVQQAAWPFTMFVSFYIKSIGAHLVCLYRGPRVMLTIIPLLSGVDNESQHSVVNCFPQMEM
jgi:hypothetical protein